MLAHDPARSGATAVEIRPPFARKWYRLFPDEGLMAGVQPVAAGGTVYLGTLAGVLHAIDDATGKDRWTFKAGGSILHTCAAASGKVFFGAADGRVYAVRAADGRLAWSLPTGAAIWNAPLIHDGVLVIGSRDGNLYAVAADTGRVRWTAPTGGPLLSSPALDAKAGRVYAASEDMRVYAVDFPSGGVLWRTEKLPGATFRGYHPVVAPDGAVMVTVAPVMSQDSIAPILMDMVKEVFGDFASWRHTKEENARLREQNFKQLAQPGTYERQLEHLRKRLAAEPAYQTFFVLDPETGKQRFVAPIVYAESMNGTGAPALVTPDGRVIVKYQALLRSRYEHYSPFLSVGYLDTRTGRIAPIMDQSRTYGWHDSLLLVHDEQCQLSLAGRVLINTHQDNVNAMDLDTLKGYGQPFSTNIHEPRPGEALSIWAHVLRDEPVPVGKEWLIRGTAVYGGGSAIDVPVSVAGDSFYYIPTHEMNSGCAVIAYKMQPGGTAGRLPQPSSKRLTPEDRERIRGLRWDWDALQTPRVNHVLKELALEVPGTRRQPLTDKAAAAVAAIPDAELDRILWEARGIEFPGDQAAGGTGGSPARGNVALGDKLPVPPLRETLAAGVKELIGMLWRPLVFPAGKHPIEAYRFFIEPTETLETLARAYPYLDPQLQVRVKRYVAAMQRPGGPLDGPTGRRTFDPNVGEVRSAYDVPPEKLWRVNDDITRSELARLYPIWLWAHATGDWKHVQSHWKSLADFASREPNRTSEDCRNGHVAGLIAYCRMAQRLKDQAAVDRGIAVARKAMRQRLVFELAHPAGAVMAEVPAARHIFARWRNLTPEVARLIATCAGEPQRHLMEVFVDYHRPTWWLAWNVELAWRNEVPFSFPTMSAEIFTAKALILNEPVEKLRRYLDVPWCKADLFYIRKIVHCVEAEGTARWQDTR